MEQLRHAGTADDAVCHSDFCGNPDRDDCSPCMARIAEAKQ